MKKAQNLNITKLKALDEKSSLSAQEEKYRKKIQLQHDILEPKLK